MFLFSNFTLQNCEHLSIYIADEMSELCLHQSETRRLIILEHCAYRSMFNAVFY